MRGGTRVPGRGYGPSWTAKKANLRGWRFWGSTGGVGCGAEGSTGAAGRGSAGWWVVCGGRGFAGVCAGEPWFGGWWAGVGAEYDTPGRWCGARLRGSAGFGTTSGDRAGTRGGVRHRTGLVWRGRRFCGFCGLSSRARTHARARTRARSRVHPPENVRLAELQRFYREWYVSKCTLRTRHVRCVSMSDVRFLRFPSDTNECTKV